MTENKTPPPADEPLGWKPVLKTCILAVVVLVGLLVIKDLPIQEYYGHSHEQLRQDIKEALGWRGPALYLILGTLLTGAGFPRTAYTAIGGALWGFIGGSIMGQLATMFGSMACFWFSRYMGRELVERKLAHRFDAIERRLRHDGFTVTLLVRLCPIANNTVTNCFAGVSAVKAWPFFAASFIGHLPMTIGFALVGKGLAAAQGDKAMIGTGLLIAQSIAFVIFFRQSNFAAEIVRELRGRVGDRWRTRAEMNKGSETTEQTDKTTEADDAS